MRKNIIAAAMAAAAALTMSNAFAAAGEVKFNGEILDAACTVDVTSQDQTVPLGKYAKSEFAAAGDTTTAIKFSIKLASCPEAITTASVRFDGTPDAVEPTMLALDSVDGAATGVAINLMTADKAQLPLHGSNSYVYNLTKDAVNTLDFYAQYKSTVDGVTGGPANAVANFSIAYN